MPVFTPYKKFISSGCHHLTQSGESYFAEIIDFADIFSECQE